MAATEKKVPISHMAQATGFLRVTIASAQPMAHAAKKKNRTWVNVICIASASSGHRVALTARPSDHPNSTEAAIRTGLKSGLQLHEVRLRPRVETRAATTRSPPWPPG